MNHWSTFEELFINCRYIWEMFIRHCIAYTSTWRWETVKTIPDSLLLLFCNFGSPGSPELIPQTKHIFSKRINFKYGNNWSGLVEKGQHYTWENYLKQAVQVTSCIITSDSHYSHLHFQHWPFFSLCHHSQGRCGRKRMV